MRSSEVGRPPMNFSLQIEQHFSPVTAANRSALRSVPQIAHRFPMFHFSAFSSANPHLGQSAFLVFSHTSHIPQYFMAHSPVGRVSSSGDAGITRNGFFIDFARPIVIAVPGDLPSQKATTSVAFSTIAWFRIAPALRP